jgi:putative membrane protein
MASHMLSVYPLMAVLAFGGTVSAQLPADPTPPGAQDPAKTKQEQAPPAGVVDEVFVAQTVRNGRGEIELSKMALTKSIRPGVKMVAQRVVDDHAKMNAELAAIASGKKMILPDDPGQKDKATLDRMEKLTGDAFDRMYITQVIADHSRSIETFKEFGEKGVDAVLKAWAAKTLLTLQQHLDLAREVEKKLES